jgi:predicted aspartyl protease
MKRPEKIPFSIDSRIPLIAIDVFVNATGPYKFILDTGASMSIVSPMTARRARVRLDKAAKARSLGIDGSQPIKIGCIDSFQLGAITLTELDVGIATLRPINQNAQVKVHGILGYNFLRYFTLSIDYADQLLLFRPNRFHSTRRASELILKS